MHGERLITVDKRCLIGMKKLLLLLFLIPNLVMAEEQRGYTAEELGLKKYTGIVIPLDCNNHTKLANKESTKMKKSGLTNEEIYEQLKKICEKAEQKERKRELRIETKCSIKSGKATNEFSAKKIYDNCLQNNNYYNK